MTLICKNKNDERPTPNPTSSGPPQRIAEARGHGAGWLWYVNVRAQLDVMATLYSYEILFKAHHVDSLLNDLKSLMTSRSIAKLSSSKSWKPEEILNNQEKKIQKGIKGIREKGDHFNSYCFSFASPKETTFREFAKSWNATADNGIGCMWTSLTVGENWGRMELTAAATSISMIIGHELFQQQLVKRLQGVSEAIVFNMDSNGSTLLYPFVAPWRAFNYEDEYRSEELDYELDVDLYADEARKAINELRKR